MQEGRASKRRKALCPQKKGGRRGQERRGEGDRVRPFSIEVGSNPSEKHRRESGMEEPSRPSTGGWAGENWAARGEGLNFTVNGLDLYGYS